MKTVNIILSFKQLISGRTVYFINFKWTLLSFNEMKIVKKYNYVVKVNYT